MSEPTLYEMSAEGRIGVALPACDVEESALPAHLMRSRIGLPQLAEVQIARHYMRLSQRNYGVRYRFLSAGLLYDEIQPESV